MIRTFAELDLNQELLKAIDEMGYERPTQIQAEAIPQALDGKDVLASAPTGTGKTASFVLPALQYLQDFPRKKAGPARMLILTPTRELAMQITEQARELAKYTALNIFTITGGVMYQEHADILGTTQDIVVATPGRLMEYIEAERFDCRAIEWLILDEADRMLDMGFGPVVDRLSAECRWRKQTLLFSATLEGKGVEGLYCHCISALFASLLKTASGSAFTTVMLAVLPAGARSATVGAPLPVNKLSDIIRIEAAVAGWSEVMPLILCSHDENFAWLNRKDDGNTVVRLANPKTAEYQVVRSSLLPGLLKTIRENKGHSVPMKIFEVSDVVFKDETQERKARNERHFAAAWYGRTSGFEVVHGLLDRVLLMLRTSFLTHDEGLSGKSIDFEIRENPSKPDGYWIEELDDATFFAGHAASVYLRLGGKERRVGEFGILHPTVLEKFDLK